MAGDVAGARASFQSSALGGHGSVYKCFRKVATCGHKTTEEACWGKGAQVRQELI